MKKQFLIEYESAQWCGGISHCVVWATDETDAMLVAEEYMDTEMRELFSDEIEDEYGEEGMEDCAYSINSVELFVPGHEHWEFYMMPDQCEFYPEIGDHE
jgi:hypothetical protein